MVKRITRSAAKVEFMRRHDEAPYEGVAYHGKDFVGDYGKLREESEEALIRMEEVEYRGKR